MLRVVIGKSKKPLGAEDLKWEDISQDELRSLASTLTLLGEKRTFLLEGALYGERGDEYLELASVFAESPHTFILSEEKLLKRETEALSKAGAKIEKQEKAEKKERGFDPFGLTFALGGRDRKKLWLGLMQSWQAGEKPEAVAGLLAWKARQMGDAKLSRELAVMYHDSHRGAGELGLLLERFVLTL